MIGPSEARLIEACIFSPRLPVSENSVRWKAPVKVQQVLDRAGAVLVVGAYGQRGWKPGETVAVSTIDSLAKRRGARGARMVLEVLVKAEAAPIGLVEWRPISNTSSKSPGRAPVSPSMSLCLEASR